MATLHLSTLIMTLVSLRHVLRPAAYEPRSCLIYTLAALASEPRSWQRLELRVEFISLFALLSA